MEAAGFHRESLLTYVLLLLGPLTDSDGGPAAGDDDDCFAGAGLRGGTPHSDLLPQMVPVPCWVRVAVARPLPTLESPARDAEKPESKLLLLLALLVLLRLRNSWMNEFIATAIAADGVDADVGVVIASGVTDVGLLRLVLGTAEPLVIGTLAVGDSNGASCYGHC